MPCSRLLSSRPTGPRSLARAVVVDVIDGDLAVRGTGPPHGEFAERLGLVEGHGAITEQLQQREKRATTTSVESASATSARNDSVACRRNRSPRWPACSWTLTWGAWRWVTPTEGWDLRGVSTDAATRANCSG